MAFQEAINNVLTEENPDFLSIIEMSINNFKYDCAHFNILVHYVQSGGNQVEHILNQEQPYIEHTVYRAYTILYMNREKAYNFINRINLEGTVTADTVKWISDNLYNTINPCLIQNIPTSYTRRHASEEIIDTLPFEVQGTYKLLINKITYEDNLSGYSINNYDNLEMVLVIDTKSGKKVDDHPGLFSEICRVIRLI